MQSRQVVVVVENVGIVGLHDDGGESGRKLPV